MAQLAIRSLCVFSGIQITRAVLRNRPRSKAPVVISALRTYGTAYEADGKTKVNILNKELDLGLMINGFSQYGFRLNNDMVIVGPMAIFPRSVLSWNISSFEEINEDSLSIFYTLEPKIDVLVIGIGDQKVTPQLSMKIIQFMKKYKINVEILTTEQACATFNFLNAESRMVAAALIPPLHITYNENNVLQTKLRQKQLYQVDDF
ncbi:NADH dehydrogenase [ubiquinone] 1 alpha subcomplex assembly factor 3 [Episyrphus balteatus]|uniref:NADH dehydrogenase [ubiquinone] 1 alpha subcomplex assembly factor 3 n=1 Tax=Episyrphus balteatus TaxID=286459 RepID=UPI0024853743|nr:NADH dehydrogenase [ubiquinone] 1 alpha subcomplex assembly factor 3 [Episyrphus balteatus]